MAFENPLKEQEQEFKRAESCLMVIFGATGDLTARKLVPALYNLAVEGQLPPHFACVGFARRDKTHEDFREDMKSAISKYSRHSFDEKLWDSFKEQIFYHKSAFDDDKGYEALKPLLNDLDEKFRTNGNRAYYLATPPTFFPGIIEKLGQHQLVYKESEEPWSRVIIEKPFGYDLESAKKLQRDISCHLNEKQIFRIDHFLGKETVQNLLVFRFSNPIFESIWNNKHVDHVQITVSEDIGIGTRGNFFEASGLLRDIVQNHMMQLLSLIAMEPPNNLSAEAIHDEKVKVLESLRHFPKNPEDSHDESAIVRGQYGPGFIEGRPVKGYREEENVAEDSSVETFAAMRLLIDNWRWAGVPFYMRAGKRLPKKVTEISIAFRDAPGYLFKKNSIDQNLLVIRIQPNEAISLKMNCKVPGISSPIQPVKMDFRYGSYFGASPPEAYERLLCDCMSGDSTLFARIDEVLASWKLFSNVLHKWENVKEKDFPNYQAGTWGPQVADLLMKGTKRKWRLL